MLIRLEYKDRVIHQISTQEITGELVVGRSARCDWPIPKEDNLVSSRHVSLTRKGKAVHLKDLGSTNGTFSHGKRIQAKKLVDGDKIGIGNAILYAVSERGSEKRQCSELLVLSGKEHGKKKKLVPPKFTIGSDPASSLVFLDMLVSRNHAEIVIHEDYRCWIRDLNSKNGTTVNGVALRSDKERLLKDGDKISFSQMEAEFHDGAVSRASSYTWLRLLIIVLTLVVSVGAYQLYKRLLPSADVYVRETRKLAAKEQFAAAGEMLARAETAHHATSRQVEILQLRRLIALWEITAEKWNETKTFLRESDWTKVARNLGLLQGEKPEAWEWNKRSGDEREKVLYAKSMLDAWLRYKAAIARDDIDSALIKSVADDAGALIQSQAQAKLPDYLLPLREELEQAQVKLQALLAECDALESALNRLTGQKPPYQEIVAALEQACASEERVIQNKAKKLTPVVKGLARSSAVYEQTIQELQALDGKKVLESNLELPSSDACALDPRVSTARQNLEKSHIDLRVTGGQITVLFKAIENIIGREGSTLPHLADFKAVEVMQRVFACDSLAAALPRRSRKTPSGDYDRLLGAEEFYAYLSALPEPLDPVLSADLAFVPLLTQASDLWKKIDVFLAFMDQPANAWLIAGDLKTQLERLKTFLDLRDGLVQVLVAKAAGSSGRDAVIAAGIACRMQSRGGAAVIGGVPIKQWLVEAFKNYRGEVLKFNDEFSMASLEEQVAIRDKVLAIGLPGDPVVRRMWAMRDAAGQN
ncbi:MAG: FHA domain-containing protein [Kiritimatiellae bacterium]|nr:FHA domain-containing protein [Kiritimatiellia bacterium]